MTTKLIIFTLGLFCSFNAMSQHDVNFYGTKYSDISIDSLPVYPGGKGELMDYLSLNFRVNQSMMNQLGESMNSALFTFIIDTLGSTSGLQIQNCPSSYVEKEFRRIFKSMSVWEPAIHNGKKVAVQVDILFDFVLKENQLIYAPQNSRVVSPRDRKKRPAIKVTIITLALAIPIIAIIMSEKK